MSELWLRAAREDDAGAIATLNRAAFKNDEEAEIVAALERDGDSLSALVAHDDHDLLGHIQFFRILVDGAPIGAGLGPMSVAPVHQGRSIGSQMVRFGLLQMQGQDHGLVFVLGHPEFYARFGFSADMATDFRAPWSGPAFMALRLDEDSPRTGRLTYPRAFGTGP